MSSKSAEKRKKDGQVKGAKPIWQRDHMGYAIGVWLSSSVWIVAVSLLDPAPGTWSQRPGVAIGVGLVAPFVALVSAVVFKGWLVFRQSAEGADAPREHFLLALAGGAASIPLCLIVIAVLPKSPVMAFEVLGMAVFFGIPVGLAELYYHYGRGRWQREDGPQAAPRRRQ